ncbi:unnamed protein product, partial [Allacma fusca]
KRRCSGGSGRTNLIASRPGCKVENVEVFFWLYITKVVLLLLSKCMAFGSYFPNFSHNCKQPSILSLTSRLLKIDESLDSLSCGLSERFRGYGSQRLS